jgi:hypothetical protein
MRKNTEFVRPVLKSFNCPSCGATLDLKAVGITVSVACPSCHNIIDVNNPSLAIISKANSKYKVKPSIPIGSRGKLSGNVYEVIGFMERKEGIYPWKEYLLYNPYVGFRWLFEMNGHWSFIKRIRTLPEVISSTNLKYKGRSFKLYNEGNASVSYVEGEFYWRVEEKDISRLFDYISPPYMLSKERQHTEITWTLGTYITPERLEKSFKLKDKLIKPRGVGANQPSPVKEKFKNNITLAALALLACLIMQVIRTGTADEESLYRSDLNLTLDTGEQSLVVPKFKRIQTRPFKRSSTADKINLIKTREFQITESGKNIKLKGYAAVRNTWIFLDTLLVNAETGKGIPLPLEISYYFGSDWTEGSKNESVIAYNVPAGTYYLSIQAQIPRNFSIHTTVSVELISDTVIMSNFYWLLIALFFPLLFTGLGSYSFEKKRWVNGSENPYGDGEI